MNGWVKKYLFLWHRIIRDLVFILKSAYKSADAGLGALFESENEGKLKVWEKKEYKFEGIKRENLPDGARRVISLIKEAADNGLI